MRRCLFLDFKRPSLKAKYRVRRWPFIPPWRAEALARWQEKNGRAFPWRGGVDPFATLVAEMLLRKTTARQVALVYPVIMSRWGTAEAMAGADLEEVEQLVKPLGFGHQRSRALIEMARYLVEQHGGRVPADPGVLQKIAHVGRYTANAVGCFAFGLPLSIVDSNVIRLMERFTGIKVWHKRPHMAPEIWRRAQRSVPMQKPKAYNYGLLDAAALLCRRIPVCEPCPLRPSCATARTHSNP